MKRKNENQQRRYYRILLGVMIVVMLGFGLLVLVSNDIAARTQQSFQATVDALAAANATATQQVRTAFLDGVERDAQSRIFYLSNKNTTVDDTNAVYLINADGTDSQLTDYKHYIYSAAWSPDGGKIVYNVEYASIDDSNDEIFVMDADGKNKLRLTDNVAWDTQPRWSPDGTKIAFLSTRDHSTKELSNYEIYVMDADGKNVKRLTDNDAYDADVSWSPDQTQMIFTSERDGNQEIYRMNTDGTQVERLTNEPDIDEQPFWSPDGTLIVFSSKRNGDNQLYLMNGTGEEVRPLYLQRGMIQDRPRWSPDGSKIVFTAYEAGVDPEITGDVYVVDVKTGEAIQLTDNDVYEGKPQWSPSGSQISFTSDRNSNWEIYVVNWDGTNPRRMTETDGYSDHGRWQPMPR
jgi:Tol biopolymer transport system component